MSLLNKRYFTSEKYAFKYLESIIWPDGPVCPKCGSCTKPYDLAKTRVGLKKCRDCKKQFTVKVGTVFESSHIALHKWMQAVYLMCSSKKGISAHQLHRTLEVTYKTAWFMCHRIREAMKDGSLPPIGGEGKSVQADETYFGKKAVVTKRTKRDLDFGDNIEPLIISHKVANEAKKNLEKKVTLEDFTHTAYGSMEGVIINVGRYYGNPSFTLLSRLAGKEIRCIVGSGIANTVGEEHNLYEVWGNKRVMVEGRIAYDASGFPVSIDVENIIKVDSKNIPLEDITDPEFTGDLSAAKYLEKLREGGFD